MMAQPRQSEEEEFPTPDQRMNARERNLDRREQLLNLREMALDERDQGLRNTQDAQYVEAEQLVNIRNAWMRLGNSANFGVDMHETLIGIFGYPNEEPAPQPLHMNPWQGILTEDDDDGDDEGGDYCSYCNALMVDDECTECDGEFDEAGWDDDEDRNQDGDLYEDNDDDICMECGGLLNPNGWCQNCDDPVYDEVGEAMAEELAQEGDMVPDEWNEPESVVITPPETVTDPELEPDPFDLEDDDDGFGTLFAAGLDEEDERIRSQELSVVDEGLAQQRNMEREQQQRERREERARQRELEREREREEHRRREASVWRPVQVNAWDTNAW